MDNVVVFRALADPTRLKILELLRSGERCACELPSKVGKSQPNVSLHLKILKDAGIISSRKDGKKIIYSATKSEIYKIIERAKNIK
ncbi:MAG: metalloregulator ArsR/SmtB family transcription factor [Candidatus Aenigmarchaeota archaeon]|nr:metalloregulator ArsR/SmtB family transcription factor [Candidatus Aenigmarchaeota archaeon]